MTPPHFTKLNQWFLEELEIYRNQGVVDEFLEDPSVRNLIYEVSLRNNYSEIQPDHIFLEAAFRELFKLLSPYALRQLAIAALEQGEYEVAEDLDWLAGLEKQPSSVQRRTNTSLGVDLSSGLIRTRALLSDTNLL